jgi:CheY-like chemotaxis protein
MLRGKRILVVEDEAVIAFAIEDMLLDLGCEVVGPAFRVEEAQQFVRDQAMDAAILDVNLNDERSYAVAEELKRRCIPFLFATGYAENGVEWPEDTEVLPKPYRRDQVAMALSKLFKAGRPG